ncbi:unnamed protein product [Cladocopium goreaui]|uniref:Ubiquitinyl hydrolase 1 n=1 Tax=Cladocopium goreaui TaxID=2562237 RepID=A0A9P1GP70_9DINO|nr:unnamed protein product [Cladocopium goreaui]
MAAEDFKSQLLGILHSAASEVTLASHQAWVGEILAALKAEGEEIHVPQDFAESQIESARLLFLACGLEDEGDTFRLPAEGQEVPLATAFLAEYAAQLAKEGTPQSRPEEGLEEVPADAKDVNISWRSEALAEMLSKTWQEEEARKAHPRAGSRLTREMMLQLGAAFERQPFGSDSCAIHSLNNLLQPKRSSEEAAAKLQEALQAAAKDEQNEEKESWVSTTGVVGPFSMATLRAAESESREEEMACRGFVPPKVTQLSLLRADSGLSWKGAEQRTGMFDVEAVKLAARSNGYEVIDVEPKPLWQESEVSSYLSAAKDLKERWFRGFLVHERIPGRAMHYYSILYWPSEPSETETSESWMILDSLDRDDSPRNRLLTTEDVISLHDQNGEFFRSWLLRWYPVVDRHAAIESLQAAVSRGMTQATTEDDSSPLSEVHAETELDACRWNVALAARRLLEASRHVGHELQVLQLVVSEEEARASLEATEWNFAEAVQHQSQRLLNHAKASSEEPSLAAVSAYAALSLTDWDSRRSAELLLLQERAQVAVGGDISLSAAAAALKESSSVHQALLIIQLIHEINKDQVDQDQQRDQFSIDEAFAARLLRHADGEVSTARQMAQVLRQFPSVPLAICAEALRRGESAAAACMLLKDFEDQVCSLVSSLATRVSSTKGKESASILTTAECQEISRLALESASWNPDVAFTLAESHALSLIQVRREIALLLQAGRSQAVATLQSEEPGEVATALSALDAMNDLQNLPPSVLLAQLQDCDMNPSAAARQLVAQQTGTGGYEGEGKPRPAPPPPPVPPVPARPRPAERMSRLSPRKKKDGTGRKGKDGKDCVTM